MSLKYLKMSTTEFCRNRAAALIVAVNHDDVNYVAEVLRDVIEMAVATAAVHVDRRREDQTGTRAAIEEDIRREAFREGQLDALRVAVEELSLRGHTGGAALIAGMRVNLLEEVQR